ncbi:MAG: GNAT family N-acetyltransferase [Deltaproteobacteria bacterium]|nr:GNAT family N-acetyltransferase [Deltaproteobacteria bacterium]
MVVGPKSRGLGREALRRFVEYTQHNLKSPTLWLTVYADNLRAQRAYAAVGFHVADLSAEQRQAHHAVVGGFSDHSLVMVRNRQ